MSERPLPDRPVVQLFLAISTVAVVWLVVVAAGSARRAWAPPALTAGFDGRESFQRRCVFCHGPEGKGDGPGSAFVKPKPRDFTRGLFKFRSTRSGDAPSDEDLFRTITDGLPGTAMMSWVDLLEGERRALVQEVKRLARFEDEETGRPVNWFEHRGKGQPVAIPLAPPVTGDAIARGREVYFRVGCNKCHGDEGRGDGLAAPGLKDDWGQPIVPRDFTAATFKGGGAPRDLFLRTLVGIEGTPMPAFGPEMITDAERWALVHYVRSLARQAPKPAARMAPPPSAAPGTRGASCTGGGS